MLPQPLRRKVLRFLHKDALDAIPILSELASSGYECKDLILDLFASMTSTTYYPNSDICQSAQTADR